MYYKNQRDSRNLDLPFCIRFLTRVEVVPFSVNNQRTIVTFAVSGHLKKCFFFTEE